MTSKHFIVTWEPNAGDGATQAAAIEAFDVLEAAMRIERVSVFTGDAGHKQMWQAEFACAEDRFEPVSRFLHDFTADFSVR